jgi:predicted nucleotidyltransferase
MPPHLRPCLLAFREGLAGVFGRRLFDVVLFGSFARGEAREDSDVDVLVLVDDLSQSELGIVATIASEHGLANSVALAPLPMSTDHFRELAAAGRALAREIERDGARP